MPRLRAVQPYHNLGEFRQISAEALMNNSTLVLLMMVVAIVVGSFTYLVTTHKNMSEGRLDIALGKTKFDMNFKDHQIEFRQVLTTALSDDKLIETAALLRSLGYYSSSDPQLAEALVNAKQDSPIAKKLRDYATQGIGVFQPSAVKVLITVSSDGLAAPHGIGKTCIGGELTESDLVVVGSDQARPIQLHVIQKLACQKADANVLQIGVSDARELLGTEQPPNQTVGYGYQTCTHPEPILPRAG